MGIFLWYGYEKPFVARAQAIVDAGFRAASLWWEEEEERTPLENLALLRQKGLEILHVHLPFSQEGRLWMTENKRKIYEAKMIQWLEELHEGEVAKAVFHPWEKDEMEKKDLVLAGGLETFERILQRAEELGVTLAAENLWQDEVLFALLDHFPSLGLCLDTGHLGISGNWEKIKAYLPRVSALHLHDNKGVEDLHLIPGYGDLPLKEWLAGIPREVAYHLEITRFMSPFYSGMKEEEYLRRAKDSLERLKAEHEE